MKVRLPYVCHHKTLNYSFYLKEKESLKRLLSKNLSFNVILEEEGKLSIVDYSVEKIKIQNTKAIFDYLGLDFDFFKEIGFNYEIFIEKEQKINENKVYIKELQKNKILDILLNYNLKDGRARAIGVIYAVSVLMGKGKEWFINIVNSLKWVEREHISKANSYYRHYEDYKNKEWVNWGWVINRFKEILKENNIEVRK
jgi:hypothetical protein